MSILDANRKFSAAMLYLAASAGNWSPYYLAYAWLTGAVNPLDAYNRDAGAIQYEAWIAEKYRTCDRKGYAPPDPEVMIRLADEISGNNDALRMMHEYALLHGLDRGAG